MWRPPAPLFIYTRDLLLQAQKAERVRDHCACEVSELLFRVWQTRELTWGLLLSLPLFLAAVSAGHHEAGQKADRLVKPRTHLSEKEPLAGGGDTANSKRTWRSHGLVGVTAA